ncbi:hypothetical protein FQN57_005448 [Myotisia sp. PD_48]|nr:hypothetical protein FQN57_005448 [Myotisia sp. PD_48]
MTRTVTSPFHHELTQPRLAERQQHRIPLPHTLPHTLPHSLPHALPTLATTLPALPHALPRSLPCSPASSFLRSRADHLPPTKRAKLSHTATPQSAAIHRAEDSPYTNGNLPVRAKYASHDTSSTQFQKQHAQLGAPVFLEPQQQPFSSTSTPSVLARPARVSLRHRRPAVDGVSEDADNMIPERLEVVEGSNDKNTNSPDVVGTGEPGVTGNGSNIPRVNEINSASRGEKRSLRSHDGGSKPSKSELAMYFPNYEQILSLEPVMREFLCPDTNITLVDDLNGPLTLNTQSDLSQHDSQDVLKPQVLCDNPLESLHEAEYVDLDSLANPTDLVPDIAMTEDVYFKAHRRLERQEKHLRNIEKERAQHEKVQLENLLAELKGHDWLRVMGISGITDSEKKMYEPKRDHFIGEVSALLNKFKVWKEEEKRRRLEREQTLNAREDEGDDDDRSEIHEREEDEGHSNIPKPRDDSIPDPDDVDGWAAHQLRQEALSASSEPKKSKSLSRRSKSKSQTVAKQEMDHPMPSSGISTNAPLPSDPAPHPSPPMHPEPELWIDRPFTSFYSKPHLRESALKKSKRARTRMAFGKPVPELEEEEFRLPADILTPEAIRAAQRRNRRLRREDERETTK